MCVKRRRVRKKRVRSKHEDRIRLAGVKKERENESSGAITKQTESKKHIGGEKKKVKLVLNDRFLFLKIN